MRTRSCAAAVVAAAALALPAAAQADVTLNLRSVAAEGGHGHGAARAHDGTREARAAHARVVRRTPGPRGASRRVTRVAIRFSQRLLTGRVDVYRGGRRLRPRRSGPRGATVAARFARPLPRGRYTARWRALAPDGHRQAGAWRFRVR